MRLLWTIGIQKFEGNMKLGDSRLTMDGDMALDKIVDARLGFGNERNAVTVDALPDNNAGLMRRKNGSPGSGKAEVDDASGVCIPSPPGERMSGYALLAMARLVAGFGRSNMAHHVTLSLPAVLNLA